MSFTPHLYYEIFLSLVNVELPTLIVIFYKWKNTFSL